MRKDEPGKSHFMNWTRSDLFKVEEPDKSYFHLFTSDRASVLRKMDDHMYAKLINYLFQWIENGCLGANNGPWLVVGLRPLAPTSFVLFLLNRS